MSAGPSTVPLHQLASSAPRRLLLVHDTTRLGPRASHQVVKPPVHLSSNAQIWQLCSLAVHILCRSTCSHRSASSFPKCRPYARRMGLGQRNPLARRLRRMPLAPWRSFEVAQHELRIAARICHWAVAIERGYHWEFSPVLRHLQASVSKQCPAASELGQFTNTPCPYFFRPHSAAAVIDEVKTS